MKDPVLEVIGVETPAAKRPMPLVNQEKPFWTGGRQLIHGEQPRHRLIAELSAQGYTTAEVAELTGKAKGTIQNTLRQQFAKQTVADAIREATNEDARVAEVVTTGALEGAQLLLETIRDPDAKRSDRITASIEFLNRRYGKPNQPVNRGTDVDLNSLSIAEVAAMLPQTTQTS